jgi:hypothetical protein
VELVEDVGFEELLVGDADLHSVAGGTVLEIPVLQRKRERRVEKGERK